MQSASIFGVTYPPYVPSGPPGYYEGILDVNEKQDWLFPPQWKSTDKHFVVPDDLPCQPSFVDNANNLTMCWPMISPSNGSAFLSSAIFSMILVLVIIPLFTAQKLTHAGNSFAFGLIVMVFVMSGQPLGVSNNPGLWFAGAISSVIVGFDTTGDNGIFTYHGSYWYVALLAPFIGAFLGGLVLELYGFAIFYPPSNWHCPTHFITAKDFTAPKGSNADDKSAREAASANVHERAYAKLATELSTIQEESDEDDAMDWGGKRNSRGDSF